MNIVGAFSGGNSFWNYVRSSLGFTSASPVITAGSWNEQYSFLRGYYDNNGLYADLYNRARMSGVNMELVKSLRNPVNRVVEFYPKKLWPGTLPNALPIVTDNAKLPDLINLIWKWSNWNTEKQATARTASMLGDMFLKASAVMDYGNGVQVPIMKRVYLQNIDPTCVSEFTSDERSYITYARIDIPRMRRNDQGREVAYTITEIWDKNTGIMRRWEHEQTNYTSIDALGEPTENRTFESMGVTFIPIVWQPFKHVSSDRGQSAFTHAIEKIDEVNKQATQLHRMLFRYNKPLWVASSEGRDSSGREMPPPQFAGGGDTLKLNTRPGEEDIVRLSGTQRLDSLVPNIDFGSHLASINEQMRELSYDMPEMVYTELSQRSGEMSGVAIRYLLDAAIDNLLEARGGLEGALIRANQMALTIGMAGGLFEKIGNYEDQALEHTFAERDVLNTPEKERAELIQVYTAAGIPLEMAAEKAGWSPTEVERLVKLKKDEETKRQADMAQALLDATTNLDDDQSPQATDGTAPNEEVVS